MVFPLPRVIEERYGQGNYHLQITSASAVWYHIGQSAVPIRWVLMRDPKERFAPQALLWNDLSFVLVQILSWFQRRWQLEVTFEQVRAHLGTRARRQCSDKAILRTTPALSALFSIVLTLTDLL
ncbi:MAG: hypothetical protein AAGE59_32520 [Cyanobacteria bacterium P01_F01_bin.86]